MCILQWSHVFRISRVGPFALGDSITSLAPEAAVYWGVKSIQGSAVLKRHRPLFLNVAALAEKAVI